MTTGKAYKDFELKELNNQFDFFLHQLSKNDHHGYALTFLRDPKESLMIRTKSAHLTFDQKFYMFNCYTDGEPLSRIWQKTGISISTAKRIVRDFTTKVNRMKIYAKVRCRKIIELTPI